MARGVAKVPQIMQMEALECGAACLAMVLAYYGRWVPLEKMRADCGVSRDGVKAENVLMAAGAHGLSAESVDIGAADLAEGESLPCIALWKQGGFVVVSGFKGSRVYLNDPARGGDVPNRTAPGILIYGEPLTGPSHGRGQRRRRRIGPAAHRGLSSRRRRQPGRRNSRSRRDCRRR